MFLISHLKWQLNNDPVDHRRGTSSGYVVGVVWSRLRNFAVVHREFDIASVISKANRLMIKSLRPQETLRALDPELLEEFLRAAKGMEAFCTPSQLSDMEFFTQCVRSQWEVGRLMLVFISLEKHSHWVL